MNNFNILKHRVKIVIAMLFALSITFLILYLRPKQNSIPVMPLALRINLTQMPDKTLQLRSLDLIEGYASDYQTDMRSNFYQMELSQGEKSLFKGKTIKSRIMIRENLLASETQAQIEEKELGEFTLYIPYYQKAEKLIFSDENGREALNINLKEKNLKEPQIGKTCGDGICTDNENLLMCYRDCRYGFQSR